MNEVKSHKWADTFKGDLNEDTLKKIFHPKHYFTVRPRRLEKNIDHSGVLLPGMVFVLKGKFRIDFKDSFVELNENEWAHFCGGKFAFKALECDRVEVFYVWPMPLEFRKAGDWDPENFE